MSATGPLQAHVFGEVNDRLAAAADLLQRLIRTDGLELPGRLRVRQHLTRAGFPRIGSLAIHRPPTDQTRAPERLILSLDRFGFPGVLFTRAVEHTASEPVCLLKAHGDELLHHRIGVAVGLAGLVHFFRSARPRNSWTVVHRIAHALRSAEDSFATEASSRMPARLLSHVQCPRRRRAFFAVSVPLSSAVSSAARSA